MGVHEEKIKLLREYAGKMRTCYRFYVNDEEIPERLIYNAHMKFANNLNVSSVLGLYDTTVSDSGKRGYLFTDTKVYYLESTGKPKKLWYDDVETMEIYNEHKKEEDQILRFYLKNGEIVDWKTCTLKKPQLLEFFTELLKLDNSESSEVPGKTPEQEARDKVAAMFGGAALGTYKQVNNSFEEEKFHSRQGHGFAAERANNLYDKITGHDAQILGDDNSKNGADRIVDGTYIQSKYCATGSRCINECFENDGKGAFRYIKDGKPMQIEVPSDKYDAAIDSMKDKISKGQIEGITNPDDAKFIVRKGHFTYEQAKNIAKFGTIESITYDATNGAIVASSAFGVTALLSFAVSIWNGENLEDALKSATYSGLKVSGTLFATSILVGQLSKAGLNSLMVGGSEEIMTIMGPKASAVLTNAFRNGSNIYGAAAMKSAAKLLRGNVITAGATVFVLSAKDIYSIFKGRISGKQLFKNIANSTSGVIGGMGGLTGGAVIGTAILPGIGTALGAIVGSACGGAAAQKASNKITSKFIEDDAEEMVRIIEKEFEKLANDYLLTRREAEKSIDRLGDSLTPNVLKDMFASEGRQGYAKSILVPIIENEIKSRRKIELPSDEQMVQSLRMVLEEIEEADRD